MTRFEKGLLCCLVVVIGCECSIDVRLQRKEPIAEPVEVEPVTLTQEEIDTAFEPAYQAIERLRAENEEAFKSYVPPDMRNNEFYQKYGSKMEKEYGYSK